MISEGVERDEPAGVSGLLLQKSREALSGAESGSFDRKLQ